ncbi:hypothetical protein, partial [Xanthomonas sp. LMG 12460]|uniref:hypothetical protein n=1 Tax=Xanthomonas sp. LMG 12460 TaxID=1591132 RepID=UPI001D03A66F
MSCAAIAAAKIAVPLCCVLAQRSWDSGFGMVSLRLLKAGMGIGGRRARNNIAIKLSDKRGCLPMKKVAAFVGGASAPTGFA